MTAIDGTTPLHRRLLDLQQRSREAGERFLQTHGEEVEVYRREISRGIVAAGESLRADVAEITANNSICTTMTAQLCEYVDWLQWSLWDLPYFAVPIGIEPELFRGRVAACGYVYLAGRALDDALDRHFSYKSKRRTIFAVAVDQTATAQAADSLTVLSGVLLLTEGLSRLAADDDILVLRKTLQSVRRAVIGAMMEHTPPEEWDAGFYERLVFLKNVDFWRCLYSAVDPGRTSPLYPFLERYYALAQKLNDVTDFPEDLERGQPNLLTVHLRAAGADLRRAARARSVPEAVENELAASLLDLGCRTESMPPLEQSVALLKLGESIRTALEIGIFPADDSARETAAAPTAGPPEPPPLAWHSGVEDVVGHWGAAALEDAGCEVCGSSHRRRLMEMRGFTFQTCLDCTHVYVSPRVRADLLLDMASRLEHDDDQNDFLEIQKIFAAPICHLLRLRASGNRLLDLGFGRGHIMRLAGAYGFEVYGMDSSSHLVRQLEPEFGKRVCRGTLGVDPIPWDSFDVIVLSHVVEHLADPARILSEVATKLAPDGLLYVAVPNIASMQFRVFGKQWDAINPMVHLQYFNEESLAKLLETSGFGIQEKMAFPPLPPALTPRWMQLFRQLGGDESGELAIVARRGSGGGA